MWPAREVERLVARAAVVELLSVRHPADVVHDDVLACLRERALADDEVFRYEGVGQIVQLHGQAPFR
jgi:hypothetical protein